MTGAAHATEQEEAKTESPSAIGQPVLMEEGAGFAEGSAEPGSGELPRTTLQQRQARNVWAQVRRDATRIGVLAASDLALILVTRWVLRGARAGWLGERAGALFEDLFPWGFLGQGRFPLALVLSLAIMRCYGPGDNRRDPSRLLKAAALAVLIVLFPALWEEPLFTLFRGAVTIGVVGAGIVATRLLIDAAVRRFRPGAGAARTIIVAHPEADWRGVAGLLHDVSDFRVVDRVTLEQRPDAGVPQRLHRLGKVIDARRAEVVVLCGDLTNDEFVFAVDVALASGCRLLAASRAPLGEVQPRVVWIGGHQLVELTPRALHGWQLATKRATDLLGAAFGLLLVSPLMLGIAIAILVESGRPVLFRQRRIGRAGRPFDILKFRSMVADAEHRIEDIRSKSLYQDRRLFKVVDDPRVTRVGRVLRRTSLDELPQLINVLRGDMSLVGPRPPLPQEVETYSEDHYRRFDVKPGITGPWQVNGRNEVVDFEEVVRLEREYIDRWSLWLDFRMLLSTLVVVFRRTGAF